MLARCALAQAVRPRTATQWQDLGGGRSLGITTLDLVLQANELSAYGP